MVIKWEEEMNKNILEVWFIDPKALIKSVLL